IMAHSSDFRKWLVDANSPWPGELWPPNDSRIPVLAREWLGPRYVWWSRPVPAGQRLAVVSSRLPRLIDPNGTWLQAVGGALERARMQNDVLMVACGTAGSELIIRSATRQALPTICIQCCDLNQKSAQAWGLQWAARQPDSFRV